MRATGACGWRSGSWRAWWAFAIVLAIVDRLSPAPEGPPSSSYATTPQGLAAYASVLAARRASGAAGADADRGRAAADRTQTLVVLDPDVMEPEEARAIGDVGARRRAAGRGRRGRRAAGSTRCSPTRRVWEPDGDAEPRRTLVPVTETSGVDEVARVRRRAGTSSAARCR